MKWRTSGLQTSNTIRNTIFTASWSDQYFLNKFFFLRICIVNFIPEKIYDSENNNFHSFMIVSMAAMTRNILPLKKNQYHNQTHTTLIYHLY